MIDKQEAVYEIDVLAGRVYEMQKQIESYEDLAKRHIEAAKAASAAKIEPLEKQIAEAKEQMKLLFEAAEAKETKTQYKVKGIFYDVVLKKATPTLDYDKAKLLEYAEQEQLTDFIKTKEVKDFDWAGFKSYLKIDGNDIIDTMTGEVLEIDGLGIKMSEERIEIK